MLRGLPQHLNGLPCTLGNPCLHPSVQGSLDSGLSCFVMLSSNNNLQPRDHSWSYWDQGSGALPSLSLAPGLPKLGSASLSHPLLHWEVRAASSATFLSGDPPPSPSLCPLGHTRPK